MKKILGIALVSILTIGMAFAHGNNGKKGKKGKQCCSKATAQQKSCSGHASTTDAAPAKSCSGQAAATPAKSCSGGASAQKPCCASKAAAAPAEQTK